MEKQSEQKLKNLKDIPLWNQIQIIQNSNLILLRLTC